MYSTRKKPSSGRQHCSSRRAQDPASEWSSDEQDKEAGKLGRVTGLGPSSLHLEGGLLVALRFKPRHASRAVQSRACPSGSPLIVHRRLRGVCRLVTPSSDEDEVRKWPLNW